MKARRLWKGGELARRVEKALEHYSECRLCPHQCGVDRTLEPAGRCGAGARAEVGGHGAHFGEERPLVGRRGSGTIFFARCTLGCLYCQNYHLSQMGEGRPVDPERLAGVMVSLARQGCHNINLVSPTHFIPSILESLQLAIEQGLDLPVVYNTGGFERVETLRLLNGIVDIYMPDVKYADARLAAELSGATSYPERVKDALMEMHRQAGDLELDSQGIARQGLLVRHLVLPGGLAGTREAMEFLAREISPGTYVNIMGQYYPAYRASTRPPLDRPVTRQEVEEAREIARQAGLYRFDCG